MYINIKSKYKKIFWLLLGFCLACIFIDKVHALDIYTENGNLTVPDIPSQYVNDNFAIYTQSNDTFLIILPGQGSSDPYRKYLSISITYNSFNVQQQSPVYKLVDSSWSSYDSFSPGTNRAFTEFLATTTDIYGREYANTPWILLYEANFGLLPDNPDYLSGYKKVSIPIGTQYIMVSSSQITSGYVYIPIDDFNNYGGRLSYFNKDLSSQPYTSYIQDYTITRDGLYARQYFDLSSYNGADWVMFSKYIYLEGEDNFTYDIWIPNESYSSIVTVTPNNSGGNDFDFSYVDENGDLQADIISSADLTPPQPLLGDIFQNFTTNDFGLSSIITAPLPLIQSLNSATCTELSLPLGMFGGVHDQELVLPCMTPLYQNWFGDFFTLYQTITTGFIAYYVGLGFFNKIKQLKDPENDIIEVVEL